jgi:hypothetical protein
MKNKLSIFLLIAIGSMFIFVVIYLLRISPVDMDWPRIALIIFLGISGCVFFVLILAPPETKSATLLMFISSAAAICLVEIGIWKSGIITEPTEVNRSKIAFQQNLEYDRRSTSKVVADMREQGNNAFPAIFPGLLVQHEKGPYSDKKIYPMSGIPDVETVLCNESGQYSIYHSDQYGFNNSQEAWQPNNIDYAVIGDSFAQGFCVNEDADIASHIRAAGKTALNFGMASSSALMELAIMREFASLKKPSTVVWIYYEGNDAAGLEEEFENQILTEYLKPIFSQNLHVRVEESSDRLRYFLFSELDVHRKMLARAQEPKRKEWVDRKQDWAKLLRLWHVRKIISDQFQFQKPIGPAFKEVLLLAKSEVESWGGELLFIYLPIMKAVDSKLVTSRTDEILEIVEDLGIEHLDFETALYGHDDPLSLFPLRTPGHFSESGYKFLAKQILNASHAQKD